MRVWERVRAAVCCAIIYNICCWENKRNVEKSALNIICHQYILRSMY